MKAIEVLGITKRFGKTVALDRITFDVEAGEAVALVGPNGAGKTTLLRILATLTRPDGGHACMAGMDGRFQTSRIRQRTGFMPDVAGMYDDLEVREYLEFFAGLHGIRGAKREAVIDDLLALLDLGDWQDRRTTTLSRGMQQRVGLARTLIHDPDILLLDEPAANLDPSSRIEIREVLKELRRMRKTILISSHILRELEDLCDQIVCIDRGRLIFSGGIRDLASRIQPGRVIVLRTGEGADGVARILAGHPDAEEVTERDGEIRVRLREGVKDHSFIASRVVESGLPLLELREDSPDLEEVFVRLTSGGEKG